MSLHNWLELIVCCQEQPELLDLDSIEQSLQSLEDTVDEHREIYSQPSADLDEGVRHKVLYMVDALDRVCDGLDGFLEDLNFDHVKFAEQQAREVWDVFCELQDLAALGRTA